MKAQLRFELLKLVHRHDFTPDQLIERARALEAYCVEGDEPRVAPEEDPIEAPPAQEKRGRGRPKGSNTGNLDILG